MATGISWTDETWNPVTGCSKVSPGCAHCYAETMTRRFRPDSLPWTPENAAENVVLHPERLEIPLRWKKPRRVFVNSMSDLFHELVPEAFILEVWLIMSLAQEHTFQILTKRPERMQEIIGRNFARHSRGIFGADFWPLPNVWLGTSVENQHWADIRIPSLLKVPAAVRFLSCEPLLGPIDLSRYLDWQCPKHGSVNKSRADFFCDEDCTADIGWVIAGGESGSHARPCDLDWLRTIRDQCHGQSVPFHLKQMGGFRAGGAAVLDGREWREFPPDA